MRFWDSSAVVPLLVHESTTPSVRALAAEDPVMLVWWGTEIECTSAIARLEREGALERAGVVRSLSRLSALAESWHEIQPGAAVRIAALRVLRVHPLRTADALQLASAVIAAEGKPDSLPMVTLDDRLGSAAEREGFVVFGPATAS